MAKVLDSGVHSMILTSGTLAPLAATIRELNIGNPIILESPHIISPDQVLVNVVCKGPTGVELRSCYMNRDNDQYWKEIGLCLQNYLRIIPDGVLAFFPSYSALNKAVEHWKSTGLWAKLLNIKSIYVEPTRKHEFNEVMADYCRAVSERNGRGAVLLGVCRGKVSEGLDFINEYGRAVLICGLPYPPLLDPKVKLKKIYLDQTNRTIKLMSGDLWYQLEATRAVNQAIGRVIRHAKDFGVILLCDVKFNQKSILDNLSKWLQPLITNKSFGASVASIKKFFNENNDRVQMPYSGPDLEEDNSASSLCQPSTSKLKDVEIESAEPERFQSPRPHVSCFTFLDDDEDCEREEPTVNKARHCSLLSQLAEQPIIQPAKRRKLKMKPLVFEDYCSGSEDAIDIAHDKRLNEAKNFLCEMKTTLDEESYGMFAKIMRTFHKDSNFDVMLSKLTTLFPVTDTSFRNAFLDCKKLLSGPHLKKFEEYCSMMSLDYT
ncbi:regulator of telomere elongation helicase 1 homolog [Rhodnius prolixus]